MPKKKKFDQHVDSIDGNFQKLPIAVQRKYKKNRARFDEEQRLMWRWGVDGCTSAPGKVLDRWGASSDDDDVVG